MPGGPADVERHCRLDAVHRRLVARALQRTAAMGHGPGDGGAWRGAGRHSRSHSAGSGQVAELKLGPTRTAGPGLHGHQRDSQARAAAMASAAKYSTGARRESAAANIRRGPASAAHRRWRCARCCLRIGRRRSGRSSCSGRPSRRTCRERRAAGPFRPGSSRCRPSGRPARRRARPCCRMPLTSRR